MELVLVAAHQTDQDSLANLGGIAHHAGGVFTEWAVVSTESA
jgi:hypothetical protein